MEGSELHPGRGALFVGLRGRQHGRGRKTQQARDDEVRELRRRIVELQRLVVVGLARKARRFSVLVISSDSDCMVASALSSG